MQIGHTTREMRPAHNEGLSNDRSTIAKLLRSKLHIPVPRMQAFSHRKRRPKSKHAVSKNQAKYFRLRTSDSCQSACSSYIIPLEQRMFPEVQCIIAVALCAINCERDTQRDPPSQSPHFPLSQSLSTSLEVSCIASPPLSFRWYSFSIFLFGIHPLKSLHLSLSLSAFPRKSFLPKWRHLQSKSYNNQTFLRPPRVNI